MMFRVAWVHRDLNNNNEPVGMLYGYMRSLLTLWQKWPTGTVAIAWDCKSKRRIEESKQAIEKGVITAEQGAYKANRVRDAGEHDELYEEVKLQEPTLLELLSYTLARQVSIDAYEADDVIGTLSKLHETQQDIVFIVSSDKDFYQLLSPQVSIFDPIKGEAWTLDRFRGEYGIEPWQWVDVGALMGDKGDNIHGVKGVGVKTALRLISQFGSVEDVLRGLQEAKKLKKVEQRILDSQQLVRLAYSLKKIDRDVTGLELIESNRPNGLILKKRFQELGFKSLLDQVSLLTRRARAC